MRADIFFDSRASGQRTSRGRFRPADAGDRHDAECRERATGKAGPAQEGSAIKATGLTCQRVCDRTVAVGMLMCSLDKHGSLPQAG